MSDSAGRPGGASDPLEKAPYLVDKSAWEQRRHSADARERLNQLAAEGRLATCLPTALEHLYSARSGEDFSDRRESLDLLAWLPITAAVESSALELMAKLARKGQHRMPLPDIILAATAAVHGVTILHYDGDFERISAATGQPHEWIIPRGTGHGRSADETEP